MLRRLFSANGCTFNAVLRDKGESGTHISPSGQQATISHLASVDDLIHLMADVKRKRAHRAPSLSSVQMVPMMGRVE